MPDHKPVMVEEVLENLNLQPHGTYLDVTFGAGGHTKAILEKEPDSNVVALDWDTKALEVYGEPLQEQFGDRLRFVWGNFALLYKIAKNEKIGPFDGILADFGTSQVQITQRPGFSVYRDTPLDMRMSPAHQQLTAAEVIEKASQKELEDIFWEFGEERYSRKIAKAIVAARSEEPIKTTAQLAKLIEKVVPSRRTDKIHPATRVFQALRIFINKELENIQAFLAAALALLKPGGHLVCITFHSLEDRVVKQFFNSKAQLGEAILHDPAVIKSSAQEIEENPSARSAKMRVVQRINK